MYAPDHPYDSTKDDLNTYTQNMVVHSINPETDETAVLFKPDRFASLHPSPDGRFLAFADQQSDRNPTPIKEIRLFDPSGNLIQTLGSYSNQHTGIYPVSWSPESTLISFGNFGKMYIGKPGGQPIEVYKADDSHVQPGIYSAAFSPDSSHFLMWVYDGRTKLVAVSADGKEQHDVTWSGQQEAEADGLIQQPSYPSWRPTTDS
jgi:Tol biopolymer transport system component